MSRPYIFESERFGLRELVPEDAQMFYELNLDPEVTRYTGDKAFQSISQAWDFLENYTEEVYKVHGFGRWAVIEKESKEKWGWCGLKKRDNGEIDMGYRIFRRYWGKGCATECGRAVLKYAFDDLGIKRIIAEAVEQNTSSFKVMEKLGFEFLENGEDHGFMTRIYQLSNDEYKKLGSK